MRTKLIKVMGVDQAKLYTSLMAIVIESGAVYSVTSLVYIICYARNSNVQNLILPILGQTMVRLPPRIVVYAMVAEALQCIASDLILLRVSLGRAWTRQTTQQATQLQFKQMGQNDTIRLGNLSNPRSTAGFSTTIAVSSMEDPLGSTKSLSALEKD